MSRAPKASMAAVKRMRAWRHGSWASFKLELMELHEIPRDQYYSWDVPLEWQIAFCHACGRKHASEMFSARNGVKS